MSNEQQSSSRRVSLDMGFGQCPLPPAPQRSMNPHPSGRSSNYGPPASDGFGKDFGNGPILPIPPVCGVPRNGAPPPRAPTMPMGRRQSAPGFYSRSGHLPPAVPYHRHPGLNFMPTAPPSMHRRGSCAPNMMSRVHMNQGSQAFNALSPSAPPMRRTFLTTNARPFEGKPSSSPTVTSDPFDNIHPSEHVGLSAEIDATVDEVIASAPPQELSKEKPVTSAGVSGNNDKSKKKQPRVQSAVSFPVKLYEILMDSKYSEYITWLPHGRAWRILKQKSFEKEVIPKHFRSARYASFMRQVNGWGFKRITEGPDLNSYYHESFLRGVPELVSEMRRPQKGELPTRKPRGFPENPDFYKISSIAPLPATSTGFISSKDGMSPGVTDTTTVSESSDELNVVSERSQRSKRPSPSQKRKNEETEAAAALFFGEVASVGSWMEGSEEWERRELSPIPNQSKSIVGDIQLNDSPPSLTSIPRELQIPRNGQSMSRDPDQAVRSHVQHCGVLSKADLAYLAQQNRLLLKQAQVISGVGQ